MLATEYPNRCEFGKCGLYFRNHYELIHHIEQTHIPAIEEQKRLEYEELRREQESVDVNDEEGRRRVRALQQQFHNQPIPLSVLCKLHPFPADYVAKPIEPERVTLKFNHIRKRSYEQVEQAVAGVAANAMVQQSTPAKYQVHTGIAAPGQAAVTAVSATQYHSSPSSKRAPLAAPTPAGTGAAKRIAGEQQPWLAASGHPHQQQPLGIGFANVSIAPKMGGTAGGEISGGQQVDQPGGAVVDERRFRCEVEGCNRAYKNQQGLRSHMRNTHGQSADGSSRQTTPSQIVAVPASPTTAPSRLSPTEKSILSRQLQHHASPMGSPTSTTLVSAAASMKGGAVPGTPAGIKYHYQQPASHHHYVATSRAAGGSGSGPAAPNAKLGGGTGDETVRRLVAAGGSGGGQHSPITLSSSSGPIARALAESPAIAATKQGAGRGGHGHPDEGMGLVGEGYVPQQTPSKSSNSGKFQCQFCSRSYKTLANLGKHQHDSHPNAVTGRQIVMVSSSSGGPQSYQTIPQSPKTGGGGGQFTVIPKQQLQQSVTGAGGGGGHAHASGRHTAMIMQGAAGQQQSSSSQQVVHSYIPAQHSTAGRVQPLKASVHPQLEKLHPNYQASAEAHDAGQPFPPSPYTQQLRQQQSTVYIAASPQSHGQGRVRPQQVSQQQQQQQQHYYADVDDDDEDETEDEGDSRDSGRPTLGTARLAQQQPKRTATANVQRMMSIAVPHGQQQPHKQQLVRQPSSSSSASQQHHGGRVPPPPGYQPSTQFQHQPPQQQHHYRQFSATRTQPSTQQVRMLPAPGQQQQQQSSAYDYQEDEPMAMQPLPVRGSAARSHGVVPPPPYKQPQLIQVHHAGQSRVGASSVAGQQPSLVAVRKQSAATSMQRVAGQPQQPQSHLQRQLEAAPIGAGGSGTQQQQQLFTVRMMPAGDGSGHESAVMAAGEDYYGGSGGGASAQYKLSATGTPYQTQQQYGSQQRGQYHHYPSGRVTGGGGGPHYYRQQHAYTTGHSGSPSPVSGQLMPSDKRGSTPASRRIASQAQQQSRASGASGGGGKE